MRKARDTYMFNNTGVQFRPALFAVRRFLTEDLEGNQLLAVVVEQRLEIDQLLGHDQAEKFSEKKN